MFDIDIKDKISIIEQSNLTDAKILSSNYKILAREAETPDKRQSFIILQNNAQLRIKKLTNK